MTLQHRRISDSQVGTAMARKDAIIKLHKVLLRRREAMRKALDGDLSMLKELNEQTAGDVVDFALDSTQDEISSQLAEVESRELAQIENALERMREGNYGQCEGCGGSIPLPRLQALPYATFCISCQREAEKLSAQGIPSADWGRLISGNLADNDSAMSLEIDVP